MFIKLNLILLAWQNFLSSKHNAEADLNVILFQVFGVNQSKSCHDDDGHRSSFIDLEYMQHI